MSKNLSVSLSIQLKQTDAKARIVEIGRELEKLGKSAHVSAQELDRLRQRLESLRSAAKLDGNVEELAKAMQYAALSDEELVKPLRALTEMKLGSTEAELNKLAVAWRNAGSALGTLFYPPCPRRCALCWKHRPCFPGWPCWSGCWPPHGDCCGLSLALWP